MSEIILSNVTKVYKGGTTAVQNLNLDIKDGEFIVLVGPSGCGKTTALRMIAGLEEITSGTIKIDERIINEVDPGDRDTAMVFQNYALYPHMTVFDNIAFPLQCKKVPKAEIEDRVRKVAGLLDLTGYLNRKPKTLSGGQRQRVAMGRALVREPRAFLMDEPLSNLDAKLRVQMRAEISSLQKELGITTVYVTHDQVEAMTMGTKIAVMRFGVLQQYGTPQEVYDSPVNIFVASFIGSPAMNFFKIGIKKDAEAFRAMLNDSTLDIASETIDKKPGLKKFVESSVVMGIRPEHLHINEAGVPSFEAKVERVELLGAEKLIYATAPAQSVSADEILDVNKNGERTAGSHALDSVDRRGTLIVRADSALSVSTGEMINLSARQGCMHFFDLNSGTSIVE